MVKMELFTPDSFKNFRPLHSVWNLLWEMSNYLINPIVFSCVSCSAWSVVFVPWLLVSSRHLILLARALNLNHDARLRWSLWSVGLFCHKNAWITALTSINYLSESALKVSISGELLVWTKWASVILSDSLHLLSFCIRHSMFRFGDCSKFRFKNAPCLTSDMRHIDLRGE